jgi:hypothetical protein
MMRWGWWLAAGAGLSSMAAGGTAADGTALSTTAPPDTSFQKVTLNGAPGEPISLAVLPDGRVLHSTRNGRLFMHDPATGFNTVVSTVPVYQHDEEGLQGIAIDADFQRNHWLIESGRRPLAPEWTASALARKRQTGRALPEDASALRSASPWPSWGIATHGF